MMEARISSFFLVDDGRNCDFSSSNISLSPDFGIGVDLSMDNFCRIKEVGFSSSQMW